MWKKVLLWLAQQGVQWAAKKLAEKAVKDATQ